MTERELWIAAALPIEGEGLERRLGGTRDALARGYSVSGVVGGQPLRLIVTGPGARRVEAAYDALRQKAVAPRAIVSTGVAGALRAGLAPGALVVASEIVAFEAGAPRQVGGIDPRLSTAMTRALEKSGLVWERGAVLASDEVLASGDEKQRSGERSRAAVVQMEDHAWAARAASEATPFASLRCVIDTVHHDIVPAAMQFPWRGASAWQVLRIVARNAGSIPGLIQLRRAQKTASAALATWSTTPLDAMLAEFGEG